MYLIPDIILIISIIVIFLLLVKIFFGFKKNNKLMCLLNKNVDVLNNIYIKKNIDDVKDIINLQSKIRTIFKISRANCVSLFKYKYLKKCVKLKFLFSINENEILHDSYLNDLPISSNFLSLEIFKSESGELNEILLEDIKNIDFKIYNILKSKDVYKMYFKNIIKNDKPMGYVVITYTENYNLEEKDKTKIKDIISKMF